MTETTADPRTAAFTLLHTTALDAAAHHQNGDDEGGQPPANSEMYHQLTATLEHWQAAGTLREDALALTEWLATELCAYLLHQLNQDKRRFERWLTEHGDRVCQAQQHPHPAGPTAVEILSVIGTHYAAHPGRPAPADVLTKIAAPYLHYLREGHEVEDAREIVLTFALWAGENLAAFLRHDPTQITGYTTARTRPTTV
jgi:hypothetical protein